MDNKVMFYVINEEGIREDAQILAKYKLANSNDYITYTYGEINDNNMIKIYTTGIVLEGGNYSYKEITTDDEWNEIKEVMKSIARDENEPINENYKSDLKLSGEEVSVRKPKKLLVSKKFADTLANKYEEGSAPEVKLEPEVAQPSLEETIAMQPVVPEVEEKEDLLNRTIEIPTFEELQARNKNIENVINSTKVAEPKVEPKVEPEIPNLGAFEQPIVEPQPVEIPKEEVKAPDMGPGYKEQFKKEVEPLLMSVYEKQMRHIEELEEELSKTKFDLFEKQKEALSLKKEKEEMEEQSNVLKQELEGAQEKMNGILNVIQGNNKD